MTPVTDPALLEILNGSAPAGPTTGPVYGPGPKVDPIAEQRLTLSQMAEQRQANTQQQNYDLQREKFDYQKAKDGQDDQSTANNDATVRTKLIATVGKLGQIGLDANDNGGWLETGKTGAIRRALPFAEGSPAYSLGKDINTARARFAFDALQAMRDASKTGGALGQVSERELDLLEAATAAIDPDMDHETFMRNVEEARQAYLSKLAMVDPQIATKMGYDATKAEGAWIKYNDAYAKEMGYVDEMPVDRTPNPGAAQYPDDIAAIMQKYGAGQ